MGKIVCCLIDACAKRRWLWIVPVVAAAIWGWVDVMPRGVVDAKHPDEHRTDFTVYTEAGAAFFDGREPYQVSNPRGWHYLYPPLFAIAVAPLHHFAPEIQVGIWFVLSVILLAGCIVELRKALWAVDPELFRSRELAQRVRWPIALAALLAILFPVLNCLQRGQVEVLKLYLLLLGLRILLRGTRRRDWCLAGAVFALPIVLKLTPALPILALVLYDVASAFHKQRRLEAVRRTVSLSGGLAIGLVAFALVVPASLLGWNANLRHLHTWFDGVASKAVDVRGTDFGEGVRGLRNQSLDNAVYRCGNWLIARTLGEFDDAIVDSPLRRSVALPMDQDSAGTCIVIARVAALALFLSFVLRAGLSPQPQPLGRASVFGLGCAATLIVCPVSRACYFMLLLPAIVFTAIWLSRFGRQAVARRLAFALALIVCVYYLVPMTGRAGLLGLGATAWFYATCALLDRSLSRQRASQLERNVAAPLESIEPSPSRRAA